MSLLTKVKPVPKDQESVLDVMCAELYGGSWEKFAKDLEDLRKGPGHLKRTNVEGDLVWIYRNRLQS